MLVATVFSHLQFPFVAQEKAEYRFWSSLRHHCGEPFLCLDISLAISVFPQQNKQQHRLAVVINSVQEARAECSSISWFSLRLKRALLVPAKRGHSLSLLQSFQGKYDTSHGIGYGFGMKY